MRTTPITRRLSFAAALMFVVATVVTAAPANAAEMHSAPLQTAVRALAVAAENYIGPDRRAGATE